MAAAHTYCPRLWREFYVNQSGDVYTCCHEKPGVLGNLHESSLREIASGARIQELRRQSIAGQLACYRDCTLLSEHPPPPPGLGVESSYDAFRHLKILFSELCNISCIMCWQDHADRRALSADLLARQVDLSPFQTIDIQGGEPLVIPDARAFFDVAAAADKKVSFLTNGLTISEAWAEKIARHSSQIHFSLNAATKEMHEFVNRGSSWEKVWRNIDRVKTWRDKLGTPLVVLGHFTIIRENLREIPLFISTFRHDFDMLNFCYDRKVPQYLQSNRALRDSLVRSIAELPGGLEGVSPFGMARLAQLGLGLQETSAGTEQSRLERLHRRFSNMPAWLRGVWGGNPVVRFRDTMSRRLKSLYGKMAG